MAIKNVLIVDDSPTDTHLLSEMLKKNGYAVSTAANAQEGSPSPSRKNRT